MKTSILRRVCPNGLNQVCVGWWGESNLNGVQSSRGDTWHMTHTHTHALMVNHIIAPPLWRMGLSSGRHCSKGGENIENELNLCWNVGSEPCFAIFCPFLSGVSNRASEIGGNCCRNKSKQSHKTALFCRFYIRAGKWPTGSRWDDQKAVLYLSTSEQNTKQALVRIYVRALALCLRVRAGSGSVAVISLVIYGRVSKRCTHLSLSWFPNVEQSISWRTPLQLGWLGATCFHLQGQGDPSPLVLKRKEEEKNESIWSSGDIKVDK